MSFEIRDYMYIRFQEIMLYLSLIEYLFLIYNELKEKWLFMIKGEKNGMNLA